MVQFILFILSASLQSHRHFTRFAIKNHKHFAITPKILPIALAITFAIASVTSQHHRLASTMAEVQLRELQIPNWNISWTNWLSSKAWPVGSHGFYWEIVSLALDSESQVYKAQHSQQHLLYHGSDNDFKHFVETSRKSESYYFYLSCWL